MRDKEIFIDFEICYDLNRATTSASNLTLMLFLMRGSTRLKQSWMIYWPRSTLVMARPPRTITRWFSSWALSSCSNHTPITDMGQNSKYYSQISLLKSSPILSQVSWKESNAIDGFICCVKSRVSLQTTQQGNGDISRRASLITIYSLAL